MNDRSRLFLFITMILTIATTLTSCVWVADYPALRTDYEYALDESIPLSDMDSAPRSNASRGFRGEAYINLGCGEAYPGKGLEPIAELKRELARYSSDDVRLVQVYVYLGEYYDRDIPQSALAELRGFLEVIRDKKVKALLRFAYETGASKDGPRTHNIEAHMRDIGDFFDANIDLVNESIYAVQLGLIGLWGEGHSAHHHIDVRRVAVALAAAVPSDIPLMVRTPAQLKEIPKELEHRFGVHDDYLVGYDHEWGMMEWTDKNYAPLLAKCKYTVTDAEMPWGKDDNTAPIDMMGVVRQAVGYGLTSLSVAHNYKENGASFALEKWKSEYLDEDVLKSEHLPYNPRLLEGGKISVYNYLKYHLGYQLVASNLEIDSSRASFMLTNYGFAMPYNYTMRVYVDGKEVALDREFSATHLVQFGQMKYSFAYSGGEISLELVNKRDKGDCIALFNDVDYVDGRNIIKKK